MSVMYVTDAQEIPFKLFFWGKRKNIEGTQKLYMEVKLEILSQKNVMRKGVKRNWLEQLAYLNVYKLSFHAIFFPIALSFMWREWLLKVN